MLFSPGSQQGFYCLNSVKSFFMRPLAFWSTGMAYCSIERSLFSQMLFVGDSLAKLGPAVLLFPTNCSGFKDKMSSAEGQGHQAQHPQVVNLPISCKGFLLRFLLETVGLRCVCLPCSAVRGPWSKGKGSQSPTSAGWHGHTAPSVGAASACREPAVLREPWGLNWCPLTQSLVRHRVAMAAAHLSI